MQTYDKADASGRQGQANLTQDIHPLPVRQNLKKKDGLALKPAIQRSTILAAVVALARWRHLPLTFPVYSAKFLTRSRNQCC